MNWFREWRLWVIAQKEAEEERLVKRVQERITNNDLMSRYTAEDVIAMVRSHDKRKQF